MISMELINQKIENIDISDIESIKLVANDYKTIQIKSENFYRVVKMILENTNKTSFEPNELESIYQYILANYETSLWEETYKKIQEILSIFVKNWGKVEVIYKQTTQTPENKTTTIKKILISWFLFISIWLGILWAGCWWYLFWNDKIIYWIVAIIWIWITIYLCILFWKQFSIKKFKNNFKILWFLWKTLYLIFILLCIIIWLWLAFCWWFWLLSSSLGRYIF